MVASSSGRWRPREGAGRVEHVLQPVDAVDVGVRRTPITASPRPACTGARRSTRSWSATTTLAPQSWKPYSSSSVGPPGVEGHGHGPDGGDGLEGDDPLGVVAHGDGHPVAVADAVAVVKQGAHGSDLAPDVGEGQAFVLVHEVVLVAVAAGHLEQEAQRGRRVGEDLVGPAVDGGVDQGIATAGAGDLGHRLVPGQWSVRHRGHGRDCARGGPHARHRRSRGHRHPRSPARERHHPVDDGRVAGHVPAPSARTRQVRVAVFTGAGDKAFMAGVDLKTFDTDDTEADPDDPGRLPAEALEAVYDCAVPVIAAVNGPALGAGLAYAAVCDLIVAADHATFGTTEINVGLLGASAHLNLLLGRPKVRELFLTGVPAAAAELHRLGAVNRVVPLADLAATAGELAAALAAEEPAGPAPGQGSPQRDRVPPIEGGLPNRAGLHPPPPPAPGLGRGPPGLRREARAQLDLPARGLRLEPARSGVDRLRSSQRTEAISGGNWNVF